jgi:hypothetical protein
MSNLVPDATRNSGDKEQMKIRCWAKRQKFMISKTLEELNDPVLKWIPSRI